MCKVISACMNKGGVCKTSIITNLGAAIIATRPDKRVLIIDMDAQGNAAMAFGTNPGTFELSVYDVLTGSCGPREAIVNLATNLDMIPSNSAMNFFAFDVLRNIAKYPNPFALLRNVIDQLRDSYDYILVDTPPSLELIAGNVLTATDYVLIPFTPEKYAVHGLIHVVDAVEDFRKSHNPSLQIAGIVGAMVDTRTTLHSEMLQQARAYCARNELKMMDTIVTRSIRFANATAYDEQPAVWVDAGHPIVAAYFELLEEVLGVVSETHAR